MTANPSNPVPGTPAASLEGRKFRFVVKSAEEAVAVIREHLGENARVLSVKQVDGKGLSKFLSSPKLEVIATVLPKAQLEAAAAAPAAPQAVAPAAPAQAAAPAVAPVAGPKTAARVYEQGASREEAVAASAKAVARVADRQMDLSSLLRKAQFDEALVARLENSPAWPRLSTLPLATALAEVFQWLSEEYRRVPARPVTLRVAFMGTPGVGKTTALCKRLASDVFIHRRTARVLKLENETPNPDDALRVFCEVLNVPFLRDPVDLDLIADDEPLYIDLPGVTTAEREERRALTARLDALRVDTRVLVVNAAYGRDLVQSTFAMGQEMRATHLVFTHLDEISDHTRLWQYLLRGNLPALFLGHGQNVTADMSENVLDYMMEKTFPAFLN